MSSVQVSENKGESPASPWNRNGVDRALRWKRRCISTFIVFNIVAVFAGSSLPVRQQNVIQRFFSPYLVWTRLLQSWQLFTPTPKKFVLNYRVEMTFQNGQKTIWRRPYPPNWDFFARHLSYSFQKWDLATNSLENPGIRELLWADLIAYFVRMHQHDLQPLRQITLIRASADVPPPSTTGYVQSPMSEFRWNDKIIFAYVLPEGKFL